jgi:hypothetical protein
MERVNIKKHLVFCIYFLIILLGFINLFVDLNHKSFDPDEYNMLLKLNKSHDFAQFIKSSQYGIMLKIHLFCAYHLSGKSLAALRFIGALFGFLTILLSLYIHKKYFFSNTAISFAFVFILSFNAYLIKFSRWGMVIYGEILFISVLVFMVFLRMISNRFNSSKKEKILYLILFSYSVILMPGFLLPITIGLIIVHIIYLFNVNFSFSKLLCFINYMKLYFILPAIVTFSVLYFFPFSQLTNPRPSIHHLYFCLGNYPKNIGGLLSFFIDRSSSFLYTALHFNGSLFFPKFINTNSILLYFIIFLGLISIFLSIFKKKNSINNFLFFYVMLNFGSIFILSILGYYPFGSIRYGSYFLIPILIILGFGLSVIVDFIKLITKKLANDSAKKMGSLILLVLFFTLLLFSLIKTIESSQIISVHKRINFNKIKNTIRNANYDFLLFDHDTNLFLKVEKIKINKKRSESMGSNQPGRRNKPSGKFIDFVSNESKTKSILVISFRPFSKRGYPGYYQFVSKRLFCAYTIHIRYVYVSMWTNSK